MSKLLDLVCANFRKKKMYQMCEIYLNREYLAKKFLG